MNELRWMAACACALWGLGACDSTPKGGTDTGNPTFGGSGNEGGGACEVVRERPVGDDASTELGFAVNDIWAFAGGSHTEPVSWAPTQGVSLGALDDTATELTVSLSRTGGARVVERAPREQTDGNEEGPLIATDGPLGETCADQLEIDVEVRLSTADGALNERFEAVLTATHGLAASWNAKLDPQQLQGSLSVQAGDLPEGSELVALTVQVTHTGLGTQGSLEARFEGQDSLVAWASGSRLAQWPEEGGCELGGAAVERDQQVFEFSLAQAVEAARLDLPDMLTWSDGGASVPVTASIEWLAETGACARLGADVFGEAQITTQVLFSLRSEDGRAEISLPLELVARPDDNGALGSVLLTRQAYLAETVEAQAFESTFGIRDVPLDGYDVAGLELGWQWDAASSTGQGQLVVHGGVVDPCVNEPVAPPAGDGSSGGSPGCRGTDFTEVLRASF